MRHHHTRFVARLVTGLLLVVAALGVLAGPAAADDGSNNFSTGTTGGGSQATVTGTATQTSSTPGTSGGASSALPTGPYEVVRNVKACDAANNPGFIIGAIMTAVGCVMDAAVCTGDQTYMWQDSATFSGGQQQTDWNRKGGACVAPGTPVGPVITVQAVVDAATVQAPPSPPHVQPGTRSFVNVPNNYWTTSDPTTKTVAVLGVPIQVTFEPQVTTWHFGDGTSAEGAGVRGARVGQDGAVEHAYARSGSYDVTTTTSYRTTFTIPGAGQQTVTLTSPPSDPVTLPVGEIQTEVDATG